MLTFEQLIQETANRLTETHTGNGNITPAVVRDVLQDAGIDECFREAIPDQQGRLIVEHIQISGEKTTQPAHDQEPFTYSRKLGPGLWAWVGPNGTGKSTILNCVIWALTGSDSGIPKRTRTWLREVIVQFSIGSEQFTSRVVRAAEGQNVTGGLYKGAVTAHQINFGLAETVVLFHTRDEMREVIDTFFMQRLGISSLRWTAHSAEKDDPDLHAHSTTWRTYANAIQIEDDSYDYLIIDPAKGFGRQDRKILEMMLGVDHSRIVAEIQVQADFAKEALGRAKSRVTDKESSLTDQIMLLDQSAVDVQQAIDMMQRDQAPVEDDKVFVERRERRAALLAEQNQLAEEVSALELQRTEMERTTLELEREKIAIREQSEVEYMVNSLAVVRCPRCESPVDTSDRLLMERQQHTCHVCTQPITQTRVTGDLTVLLGERDDELAEARGKIRAIQENITSHQNRLAVAREETAKLSKELETNVQQARQGFTTSYANLLVRKGQIGGQIERLKQELSEIATERSEVEVSTMWHLILQTASEIADDTVFSMYQDIFNQLSVLVVDMASLFGFPDLERVVIDEKRYVKVQQGGMVVGHNELARSERVKFKIAFHLALSLLQIQSGMGKHPGFLIIDTPGTAEVNDADFVEMTRDLVRIQKDYGDKLQILLATARPEALDHLPTELVQKPTDGAFF